MFCTPIKASIMHTRTPSDEMVANGGLDPCEPTCCTAQQTFELFVLLFYLVIVVVVIYSLATLPAS